MARSERCAVLTEVMHSSAARSNPINNLAHCYQILIAQVLIRDLSDDTVARLKAKAKANGVTLQAILKESVEKAAMLTPAERLAALDKVRIVPKFTEAPGQTLRDIAEGRASRPGMEDWPQ
jgi:hypothetical protein